MRRKFRSRRPSWAGVSAVLSCLALFVALGGIGYAKTVVKLIDGSKIKKASIPGDRLKNDTVTGKQVKERTLGIVPRSAFASSAGSATTANTAGSANTASNAGHANSADSATNASHATNADQLGGNSAAAFIQTSQIGGFTQAPGVDHDGGHSTSPDCNGGTLNVWVDRSNNVNESSDYWRDPFGTVHLRGSVKRCGTALTRIYTLPDGFRPGKLEHFAAAMEGSSPDTGQVTVGSNGDVTGVDSTVNGSVALDGITFRCAPSGSNGCP